MKLMRQLPGNPHTFIELNEKDDDVCALVIYFDTKKQLTEFKRWLRDTQR